MSNVPNPRSVVPGEAPIEVLGFTAPATLGMILAGLGLCRSARVESH